MTELKSKLKELLANNQHATHANHIKTCMDHANILCGHIGYSRSQDTHPTMLIWTNGTSFGLTPFKSNFIDYDKCNIPVKKITKVNTIIGFRTTIHKFVDTNGKDLFLP